MKNNENGSGCNKGTHLEGCGRKCDNACPVIDTVGRKVLFVNKTRTESCPFELFFGDSVVCTCPVRMENYFA
ncbi:MAG: hypothetical protein WC701_00190 [Kiritimatiellales bacterium]|jgi:hypothetical protein